MFKFAVKAKQLNNNNKIKPSTSQLAKAREPNPAKANQRQQQVALTEAPTNILLTHLNKATDAKRE